jgi:hypothetical protein|tara:strand:+ start:1225 stop:1932 length:708 start_codon:yes stop_codon:yes gene_type:complete
MAKYLPKSKYKIKYTNGGLLAYVKSNLEYIGTYVQTSTNKYMEGSSVNGPSLKLLSKETTNMDRNQRALQYSNSKPGVFSNLSKKQNLPSSKPPPNDKDYNIGHFTRHFIQKNNEPNIIYETSKEYIEEYTSKIDDNLYSLGSVKWVLTGEDASFINNQSTLGLLDIYPYINILFPQPDEYVEIEEDNNQFQKLIDPNQMLDEIPSFTLEQWNMFNSLDKEKLIIKYGEVNISDL